MKKIDFVITWVDGNDSNWLAKKKAYEVSEKGDSRDSRYRDWDNLRYWFRAVEKNAPWVNNVYFVTEGHLPEWLNLNNSKLKVVKHSDFIPEQYLPTFSCRPIEFNLHRISGLSEQFVYFNDDMFLLQPVKPRDFFLFDKPRDCGILNAIVVSGKGRDNEPLRLESIYTSNIFNTAVINRNFKMHESMKKYWFKWFNPIYGKQIIRNFLLFPWNEFPGFMSTHLPYSYLKSTFYDIWENEREVLNVACEHKFRNPLDVSSRVMSYWQVASGQFFPRSPNVGRQFAISNNQEVNDKLISAIVNQEYKMICANDGFSGQNYESIRDEINDAFSVLFPNKSSFEL